MKPVLLLGGNGFIGEALAQRLRQVGIPVRVVSRVNVAHLEQLLLGCGTAVHLATCTTPGTSAQLPELEQTNLQLTQRLVNALQCHPTIHLIFFSSGGTVYGNPSTLPIAEHAPLLPLSNYGLAKVAQEDMCNSLRSLGHAVTILRPSNAYGPNQFTKGGFGLIPTILQHARMGTTLQIWGDGENLRDYIYIDDLVEAAIQTIHRPDDAGTYNVGSGCGYTVNQVKLLVEQIIGQPVDTSYQEARGVDVRSVILDSSLLKAKMDWRAKVSLPEGINLVSRSVSKA